MFLTSVSFLNNYLHFEVNLFIPLSALCDNFIDTTKRLKYDLNIDISMQRYLKRLLCLLPQVA